MLRHRSRCTTVRCLVRATLSLSASKRQHVNWKFPRKFLGCAITYVNVYSDCRVHGRCLIDTGYKIRYMGELRLENYNIVGQVSP